MLAGFPFSFRSARVRLAVFTVVVAGLGGGGVIAARARLTTQPPAEAPSPGHAPAAAVAARPKPPETRIPSRVLTLRPGGFDPAEVQWPKGRFFLTVDNRSNANELALRLEREAGGHVKEIKLGMRKERSAGVLDLPPGNYLLTEVNHPGWVCRIRITPQ